MTGGGGGGQRSRRLYSSFKVRFRSFKVLRVVLGNVTPAQSFILEITSFLKRFSLLAQADISYGVCRSSQRPSTCLHDRMNGSIAWLVGLLPVWCTEVNINLPRRAFTPVICQRKFETRVTAFVRVHPQAMQLRNSFVRVGKSMVVMDVANSCVILISN